MLRRRRLPALYLTALALTACAPAAGTPDAAIVSHDACGAGNSSPDADDASDANDANDVADAVVDSTADAAIDVTMDAVDEIAVDAGSDGGLVRCSVNGNLGQCMDATECSGLPSFEPVAGYCPGAANIQCCVLAPNVANNPPVPSGWVLMQQADVTPEMTTWAVAILHDPVTYPMFSTAVQTFGTVTAMARVEWHPPDFQNSVIHRGVTLYKP